MKELLIVASKIKKHIKDKAEMNTSASALEALSQLVLQAADQAIENAKKSGRKTVMDRDIKN